MFWNFANYGSDTSVLCTNFQNWFGKNEMDDKDEQDFARYEFKLEFRRDVL